MYAVLIPWVKNEHGESMLLEVRSDKVKQPGEVCFPGGRAEPGETVIQAAVRETCEELGVSECDIEVFEEREPLMMNDGRKVHIVAAALDIGDISSLTLSKDEVAEVFLLPVEWLQTHEMAHYDLDPTPDEELPEKLLGYLSNYEDFRHTGETDYIEYDGHGIWGLTARIIKREADRRDRV